MAANNYANLIAHYDTQIAAIKTQIGTLMGNSTISAMTAEDFGNYMYKCLRNVDWGLIDINNDDWDSEDYTPSDAAVNTKLAVARKFRVLHELMKARSLCVELNS